MKIGKKIVSAILVVCFGVTLLTGCGGGKELTVSASELAEKLSQGVGFTDQMSKAENRMFFTLYDVEETIVSDVALYVSTGATAEEVAVITVADSANLPKVEQAVRERVASQKEGFENYVPEELTKLSDPVIRTSGNTVILCVSDHNDKANEIIDGVIK